MPKVRDALKMLRDDGWYEATIRGSHRVFKHPAKDGIVVLAGQGGDDIPPGTWAAILRQAQLKEA
jgi:predicted RNA binding protein YcfA (HicA-like mRNA interferase family)